MNKKLDNELQKIKAKVSHLGSINKLNLDVITLDRKRIESIAIKLVLWNAKKIDDETLIKEITELLEPEFKSYWSAYCRGFKSFAKQVGLIKDSENEKWWNK